MKLKIKPSAKTKRRYLLLKAESKKEVEKTILDYIGILGWSKASPIFVSPFKNRVENKIILSVDRKELTNIRAAFELSKSGIKIEKVSGTIAGLQK